MRPGRSIGWAGCSGSSRNSSSPARRGPSRMPLRIGGSMIMLGSVFENEYGHFLRQPDQVGGHGFWDLPRRRRPRRGLPEGHRPRRDGRHRDQGRGLRRPGLHRDRSRGPPLGRGQLRPLEVMPRPGPSDRLIADLPQRRSPMSIAPVLFLVLASTPRTTGPPRRSSRRPRPSITSAGSSRSR